MEDAGGYVRIYFPVDYMAVSSRLSNCRDVDNKLKFTCKTNLEKNYIEFILSTSIELEEGGTTSRITTVLVDNAVNLPMTIAKADGIRLTTSAGEERKTYLQAKAGALKSVELTPADQTVGSDTTLIVSLTTAHAIPKKGKLHIGVSKAWNEGALDSPVDYFSSITCNSFTINGRTVDDGSYVCSFFDNNRVEVDGGF